LKAKNEKNYFRDFAQKESEKIFMSIKMRIENKKMKKLFQQFTSMY
jgi:hypothetical protein